MAIGVGGGDGQLRAAYGAGVETQGQEAWGDDQRRGGKKGGVGVCNDLEAEVRRAIGLVEVVEQGDDLGGDALGEIEGGNLAGGNLPSSNLAGTRAGERGNAGAGGQDGLGEPGRRNAEEVTVFQGLELSSRLPRAPLLSAPPPVYAVGLGLLEDHGRRIPEKAHDLLSCRKGERGRMRRPNSVLPVLKVGTNQDAKLRLHDHDTRSGLVVNLIGQPSLFIAHRSVEVLTFGNRDNSAYSAGNRGAGNGRVRAAPAAQKYLLLWKSATHGRSGAGSSVAA